jgi:hypothetical protein
VKIPKTLPSPALRITVTKIPTFFDNHKHSGTSHRLAMTIQAVPAAACQIPIEISPVLRDLITVIFYY